MMLPTKGLLWRVAFLFLVGVFFSLMLDFFQIQYRLSAFERNLIGSMFMSSPWWVPAICGTAAVSVGLLYPCVDHKLGEETIPHRWSDVMKCIALFVGINQASAKIELQSDWQPSLSLVLLSVSLWWLCDRTHSGFGLSILTALIATLVAHFLVYYRIGRCSDKDLTFVRSWLPCVFFSGGITVGNIGRLLALDGQEPFSDKKHQE
uniref:Putative insulin-induced protein n=1 Tax=Ixodes ricinus TaxID=34613 RepID=V5GLQ4_IXORI